MPDYFDRLLARYTPVPAGGGAPRVRPRLPGPFERVEALRSGPPDPGQPAALIPSAPHPAFGPAELVRHEREIRTDRETVVRTETAAVPGESERRAEQAVQAPGPLLRPAAPAPVAPRPATADVPRAGRRGAASPVADTPRTPTASVPRATEAAPRADGAPARPRGADTATARGAALAGVGRRAPRPAERVVHVQIGRLEVSASPPPGASRPSGGRPEHTGRRAPALTLDDYLSRGEKRD
ncbi:hypothetical protein FBY35_4375 [Streptomyces sp. SLBN-118]|uniref:hypothetical protein n=1 Tax=Streptomyces sp. SLBN-118 TaxID=2768454 RepID=UPI0011541C0B|nr:hypothetical protein [Streptomyces sp. SLBN-118]TQK42930.1 hypothetical protein FBY35_4375 [Streptomyces sp. SLBN-118]